MVQVAFVFAIVLVGIVVAAYALRANWEQEKRTSYEEYLSPALAEHGLKLVESKPPLIAVYPKPVIVEICGIDVDRLSGKRWAARDVTMEDANGRRTRSRARLNFDGSGLASIEWRPELPGSLEA